MFSSFYRLFIGTPTFVAKLAKNNVKIKQNFNIGYVVCWLTWHLFNWDFTFLPLYFTVVEKSMGKFEVKFLVEIPILRSLKPKKVDLTKCISVFTTICSAVETTNWSTSTKFATNIPNGPEYMHEKNFPIGQRTPKYIFYKTTAINFLIKFGPRKTLSVTLNMV